MVVGGANQGLNGLAIAANTAALAADTAAGITGISSGAGLALGLASDTLSLGSAIAGTVQAGVAAANAPADATAGTANAAAVTADTAAGTANGAAAAANTAAGTADTAAGTADTAAGAADATAGTTDATAGTTDTAAAVADGAAAAADVVAGAQGGIDPVADGVAAGLDTAGAVADTAAGTANTVADVANAAADAANGTAATADGAADTANAAAVTADTAAGGSDGAAATANATAGTALAAAATTHTATAASNGVTGAAYAAAAAADGFTASLYGTYANGISSPNTTGNNPNNSSIQATLYGLAVTEATTHAASAAAETAAAVADTAATAADATAATADTAAATAVAAATAANAAATTAIQTGLAANAALVTANAAAVTAKAAATTANAAAIAADSAAEGLEAAAGIADGVSAGADAGAAAADTTAIALDATALATIEIPFVDIATAVAAGIADGVAAGLDATSVAADTADGVADGLAVTADGVAAAADTAATAADATATAANAAAATAYAAASSALVAATTANTAATTADAAAATACATATAANEAADSADQAAATANKVATAASAVATAADIAFTVEVTTVQGTQTSLQTQTMSIADQLSAGIRSLDLRGALVNDTINLNAGQDFTGVTLQDGLNDMTSFSQANPSETIVVRLSANEATPINSSNDFNTDLNTLLNSPDTAVPNTHYKDFIYSSSDPTTTPDLGQVRGKIVIIPSGWTPTADTNGQTIGWQPTEVVQDSHTVTDPNTRWNYAENDNGANDNGLIPTDLGNPSTLYRNNLTQDNASTGSPVALGDSVNAIAEQYFASGSGTVTRTTGIVGMDDPDQNLINEIINENNLPIVVTSDSDAPGDTGTLRDAITQANSQPGVNTIVFADDLSGTTGNTIVLQSDLPQVTNDLVIAGPVFINTNGHQGLQAAPNHNVTETDYVASDSGVTQTPTTYTTPVYLDNGLTEVAPGPVAVDPVHITYGTALDNSQLHGIATDTSGKSIPGTFSYTSAEVGTVLHAGNDQSEAVTFTPTDTSLTPSAGTVTVNVAKATPAISNVPPVNITYGTALDDTQLSGTATVPGTFTYTSAAGHVLHAGPGQSESITFIPTDTTDYTSVSSTVTVNVAQATPKVTVDPVNISFGTALDNTQLSGTATFTVGGNTVNVPGTFTYTSASAAGTVLNGGDGQSEAVTFTPADTTDYATVSSGLNVIVNVSSHATPTVAISPVNIIYGTVLDNTQLNGTAIFTLRGKIVVVPGTFTYTSAAGSVLNAGKGQSEAVTFTPTDTTTYTTVSSNVFVNVAQATPAISNVNTVNITYGTALDNTQLSGTATFTVGGTPVTVDGTFTYTSAAGSVLNAATNGQSEAVTFTPNDTTDYTPASGTVIVNVAKATPIVGSVNAVTIIYDTALDNSQLSGTVTFTVDGNLVAVPGTFTYTSAAGSQLDIGNGQSEAVTFTPNDTTDYTTAFSSVTVNVAPITPTVTVTDAGGIYKGSPRTASGTVTGVAGANLVTPTNPTFLYYLATDTTFAHPLAGAPSDVGNYVAVCLYAATGNYGVGAAKTSFAITPAATATSITSSVSPAVYGQQITYTATVTNTSGTAAAPAGAVQFVVDGVNSGSPVPLNAIGLNAVGQAVSQAVSAPISFLTGSSHSVQAVYIPSPIPSPNFTDFTASSSASLNQAVQSIAVEGTALFIGSNGATSADQIQINPIGSSNTGSTGVKVQTTLNGVNTQTTYSQSFSTIYVFLQGGNENVQLANTLTINAVVRAGNGNDNVQLGGGNNTVTLGNGNDNVSAGNGTNNVTVGNGNDSVTAGKGNNTVTVGKGNDNVTLGNGNNVVMAGTGNDNIQLGNGSNTVTAGALGSTGNIQVQIGNGANNLVTLLGNGNDHVQAGNGAGDNASLTGNGNDQVTLGGGAGDNASLTGNGNDQVTLGNGNYDEALIAGNGNDQIQVGNGTGDSVSLVGTGNDNVQTGTGSGTVHIAGTGHKTLNLGSGWTQI